MKLNEVDNPTAAFVFGRFNPPTIGHKKLFDKLKTVSDVYFVFVSPTQDPKKNPLNRDQKIALIDRQFPEAGDHIINDPSIRTIIDVMKFLETAGHKRVAMVVGSDRTKQFNDLLAKYNGKEYSFDSIDVISAGDRDPDSEGVAGVSASKAREAAQAGDYETFKTMFVGNEGLKKNIYRAVRTGMGIREGLKSYIDDVEEDIRKVKGGYRLVSKKSGKNLGTYPTRAGAEKRERQVQYFKHKSEDAAGVGTITKQNTTPDVNKKTLGKIMKALRLK